jgi:hypothetical protein
MNLVQDEFNRLSGEDQEMILENPIMREMFSETWSTELGLPLTDVLLAITQLVAKRTGNLEEVFTPKVVSPPKSNVQNQYYELMDWHEAAVVEPLTLALWHKELVESGMTYAQSIIAVPDDEDLSRCRSQALSTLKGSAWAVPKPPQLIYGLSLRAQERRARLLSSFTRVLSQHIDGLSKTQLLSSLNKDNGSWRGIADEVLEYMVQTGKAVRVGTIFYSTNHAPLERENSYHRIVYEFLVTNGSSSVTTLLKHMGYNNSKGRKKIREVLHQLYEEGYIITKGRKWETC